jgi:hypothetical protein
MLPSRVSAELARARERERRREASEAARTPRAHGEQVATASAVRPLLAALARRLARRSERPA